ncbi:unnamed protein product [Symbiodinium microadriaticum]|nr:unnamed protein product [Symbiodinium microadriaticum]
MYLAEMRPHKRFRPSSQDAQVASEVSLSKETLRLGDTMKLASQESLGGSKIASQESLGGSKTSLVSEPQIKVSPKALFSSPVAGTVPSPAGKSPGKTTWVDHAKRDHSPDGSAKNYANSSANMARSRQMISAAWDWAKERNLLRVNPVHKEEEAKLVLSEVFEVNSETGAETSMSGTIEAEDDSGFLFEADAPSVHDSDEAILASITASGVTEKPVDNAKGSFKINFPTVGKDQTPATLLGNFLEVLGRKADSLEDHLVFEGRLLVKGPRIIPSSPGKEGSSDGSSMADDLAKELLIGFEEGVLQLYSIVDPMLRVMGQCAENKGNECRNLHAAIHRSGKTFPVSVNTATTRILNFKGKVQMQEVEWPVLYLSDWVRSICASGGEMLLAGHTLNEPDRFTSVFETFWDRYKFVNPGHSIYDGSLDLRFAIPVACHGDEGRGKLKRPVMILSFQHSFTSRLLFTVMPSENYYKKQTLDMLHAAMVKDLETCYKEGITDSPAGESAISAIWQFLAD